MHTPLIPQPSHKRLRLLRALALASLAIAGLTLPFAWDILASINRMPKMHWLQQALVQAPALSWLMMFVWGAAIPLVLLKNMEQTPSHKLRTTVVMLILMWIAVTWYVHMPASNQCGALYASWAWACTALQWGYSMSLVLSIAAYVFLMLGLMVTALGLLAEGLEDEPGHAT